MQFSEHYTYKKIIRYTVPPIIMMIFTSLYSVVDGLFLSNCAGKQAFSAVSFIMPYLMMFNSTGFMLGTGSSALIAKKMGEKKYKSANEIFTTVVVVSIFSGVILSFIGLIFLTPVASMQGAKGELLNNCLKYGRIYLLGVPACIIQFEFEALYSTSGKSKLGLYSTIISGLTNVILDALFLYVFSWNIKGAAAATIISQYVGGIIPIIYYSRKNKSNLRLVKCKLRFRDMIKVCTNGSSEMVNNISISVVSLMYNIQLLKYAGDDGIAAFGIMMYVNFLFTAVFWGYVSGISPIISFNYGAKNSKELHSLLKKSIVILTLTSISMFMSSVFLATPVTKIFVNYDAQLLAMTIKGFYLFSFSFLFSGMSIFSSSFFTSLNNGFISAVISFSRVFLFQIPAVLILPLILGLDGIWLSVVIAELLTVAAGTGLILKYRKKYNY